MMVDSGIDHMSLAEEEDEAIVYDVENTENPSPNVELSLVGRFLIDKPIRTHIMRTRMAVVWRPGKGVTVQEVE